MITKERLEELIEQGKLIYSTDTKLYGCVRMLELENKLEKLEFDKNGEVKLFITENGWWHWFSLKDLYENKEDVEEILEFGNITRTEKLKLPSWEDFKKTQIFLFESKEKILMELAIWESEGNRVIKVTTTNDWNVCFFNKPLTRENYNEARRICVKLFKGEGVDG